MNKPDVLPWRDLSWRGQARRIRVSTKSVLPAHFHLGRLLRHGENTLFQLIDGEARQVLRVHRPGYHSAATIRSELVWLGALRAAGFRVPEPVPWPSGDLLLRVPVRGEPGRWAVRFQWMDGRLRSRSTPLVHAQRVGRLLAELHEHGMAWTPPADFTRPAWQVDELVGPGANWGDPRHAVEPDDRNMVDEACARAGGILMDARPEVGLVHHDLHAQNLLHHRGRVGVIDFDDCGTGYFLMDWWIAKTTFWHQDHRDRLDEAFLSAYRAIRHWEEPDPRLVEAMDICLSLRHIAWLQSRSDVPDIRGIQESRRNNHLGWIRKWLATAP